MFFDAGDWCSQHLGERSVNPESPALVRKCYEGYVFWTSKFSRHQEYADVTRVSTPDGRRHKRFVNKESYTNVSLTRQVQQLPRYCGKANHVVAAARVKLVRRHSLMDILTESEREQVQMWRNLLQKSVDGILYFFQILGVWLLGEPQPMQNVGTGLFFNFVSPCSSQTPFKSKWITFLGSFGSCCVLFLFQFCGCVESWWAVVGV